MSLQEQGHRSFIKNTIERIKEYRFPPLNVILNGSPKDRGSNIDRTTINLVALQSSVVCIALSHLHPSLFAIPGIYAGEIIRQGVLSKSKSTKSKK